MKENVRTFFTEFKEFAVRGNAIDLAVGIVIGTAFGKIVSSLVADIVTPPLGILLGGVDFKNLSVTLKEAEGSVAPIILSYGAFLQSVIDFVIIAFAIFLLVKSINTLKRKLESGEKQKEETAKNKQEELLEEIRDLLKANAPRG